MAITATDIIYRYTQGNTSAQTTSTAAGSLGGTVSSSAITDNSANNLFDDVSGAESAAGDTEYRAIGILNNHGSLTWQSVVVWISSDTTSADTDFDVALDPDAAGGATACDNTIANESTAPTGVTFANTAVSKGTGLSIGNLTPGQYKVIWVKRVVSASAAAASDTATIRVEGDTAP